LQSYEFCRVTKIHLDEILSENISHHDVSLIIEAMQQAIEFENELARRFPINPDQAPKSADQRNQVEFRDGKVEVQGSGSADDIRAKYAKKDEDEINAGVFEKFK
jgi:hypothetical protein